MAIISSDVSSFTFSDFPEDVQICILSCLAPCDISSFACTSKRFNSLCRNGSSSRLWYAMCDRRWGSKTQIRKWGDGKIDFNLLFRTLSEYENLIGFWRISGGISSEIFGDAPLVFFEWGVSCVVGSRVSPSKDGSYKVNKSPFIWLKLSADGHQLNHMKTDLLGGDSIQVSFSFMGKCHVILEEANCNWANSNSPKGISPNKIGNAVVVGSPDSDIGSPPDRMTSEMYQYFANRTSPGAGGERAWRRQRRREKERLVGRKKWEPQHLVKIVHSSPSPSRPLQGLWKGICDDTNLDFYLVSYDDIGGVSCRRVGDSLKPFSGYAPVFWTSNATFIDSPLSHEEDYLYHTRVHIRPTDVVEDDDDFTEYSPPSRIMYINSSYDLVIPDLVVGTCSNPRQVEGRVWQYDDGTFGFGYLRNNFIVDLKQIALHGRVLDAAELSSG